MLEIQCIMNWCIVLVQNQCFFFSYPNLSSQLFSSAWLGLLWPPGTHSIMVAFLISIKSSIYNSSELLNRAFFILEDMRIFQCNVWYFVSASYWKIHISSHVMIFVGKYGCSVSCSMMSKEIFFQLCFCSWEWFFENIFANISIVFNSYAKFVLLHLFLVFVMWAIVQIFWQRSFHTILLNFSTSSSVLAVSDRLGSSSSLNT